MAAAAGRILCKTPAFAGQRGFTMVELIVTMMVIGALAVVVIPRLDAFGSFDEGAYRDKVQSVLEYARKAAVAQRRHVCVGLAANRLVLTRDLRDPDMVTAPNCTAPLALPVADRLCSGASPGNQICPPNGVTIPAGPASLRFSPIGRATAASYVYTVQGGGTAQITVEAETGYVR